jgi:gluconolactonase
MTRAALAAFVLLAARAAADPAVIDDSALFPEGPWVDGGRLVYVEYAGNTMNVWDGTTTSVLWSQSGCGPSSVVPFGDGWLVACYDSGTLVALTAGGAVAATYDKDEDGLPIVGPNDIAVAEGGVWITASGPWESAPIVGKVYWLAPGDAAPRTAADDLHYANGIALSPGDGRLYVGESEAGRVISFAVGADHTLGDRRLFARLFALDPDSGASAYPDGMEFGLTGGSGWASIPRGGSSPSPRTDRRRRR